MGFAQAPLLRSPGEPSTLSVPCAASKPHLCREGAVGDAAALLGQQCLSRYGQNQEVPLAKGLFLFQREIFALRENQLITSVSQRWNSPTFYNFLNSSKSSDIVICRLCDTDNISLKCCECLKQDPVLSRGKNSEQDQTGSLSPARAQMLSPGAVAHTMAM